MQLSKETIKEIAENLDCGLIAYVHKQTKAVTFLIDVDPDEYHEMTGTEQEGQKEIEDNYFDYLKIEKMSSREAYKIMEAFTYVVSDIRIRVKLMDALEKRKPFQNFKYEVDYNEEIRQQWFKFKAKQYREYVERELTYLDEEE
jgi:hypothetical protein